MPDSNELRLIGTFQDKISPGLKSSIDKIRAFTKEGQKAGEDGERSVKKHAKAFSELRDRLKETVALSRDGFLPGLEKTVFATATAGIGIGTVTAAIGLAVAAAKNFSTTMLDLKLGARETGLSAEQLRMWENFGDYAGIAAERVKATAGEFGVLMEHMKRRPDWFRQMFATPELAGMAKMRDFALTLKDLPRDQQLREMLKEIAKIRDVGQQKSVLEAFKLPPEFAALLPELQELEKRAGATVTIFTPEQIQAGVDAAKNWKDLADKMQDLSLVVGAKFSPAMSEATEELRLFITANQDAWSKGADAGLKEVIKTAKEFADLLNTIVNGPYGLNVIMEWESRKHFTPPIDPKALPPDLQQKREQFEKLNPGGLIHKEAFIVGGDGGSGGGAGLSKGTSDMINVIAQGTRRGVYDGLMDFSQTPAGAGGGGGGGATGIIKASLGGAGGGRGGGTGGFGGGGTPSTPFSNVKGTQPELAQKAYDYWRSQGLGRDAALAIIGNERGENVLGSLAIGGAGEMGQFQWKNDRRQGILAGTGIDVKTAGFLQQQMAARWELEHKFPKLWEQLKSGKMSLREAVWGMVHQFEGSASQGSDLARRGGYAEAYGKILKDQGGLAAAPGHSKVGGSDPIDPNFLDKWRNKQPAAPHHYLNPYGNKEQQASLLRASRQANAGSSTVRGEAKLSIELAGGLRPSRGVKNEGSLFKEIQISRGSIPYASTES